MANEFTESQFTSGTAANPSIHFGDPGTGLYRSASGQISFSAGGEQVLEISNTGGHLKRGPLSNTVEGAFTGVVGWNYRDAIMHTGVSMRVARGTEVSPDYCTSADQLYGAYVRTWNGTDFTASPVATIVIRAAATHALNDTPTDIIFTTTPAGSTTAALALTVGSDQSLKCEGSFSAFGATPPATQPAKPTGTAEQKTDAIIAILAGAGLCAAT